MDTFESEDLPFDFHEPTPEEIEARNKKYQEEVAAKGFLPVNNEYDETMSSPQEMVEKNPRRFIIEECIPACQALWRKNIYTFMVSDHLNEGVCWIEVIYDTLSDENKEIFQQLSGDDIIKFSYHNGTVNFGVNMVGEKAQKRLLEIAKMFRMQDVPEKLAYLSEEDFLLNHCGCYDEVNNPDYYEMLAPWERDLPMDELITELDKYDEWKDSIHSQKTIRIFNPNKTTRPVAELAKEHGFIYEDGRIYLGDFHYYKHHNYINYLQMFEEKKEEITEEKRELL